METNFALKKTNRKCSRCTGWNSILLDVWCLSAKLSDYSFISADEDFDEEEDGDYDEEEREDQHTPHLRRGWKRGKWLDQFCVMGMYYSTPQLAALFLRLSLTPKLNRYENWAFQKRSLNWRKKNANLSFAL